jgi:hypothetical protein
MIDEKVKNPHSLSPILFITDINEKDITVSPSAVYLDKAKPINSNNIVNETGLVLNRGDKIMADARIINGVDHIVIKRVLAKQQPIARTTKEYVKLLRICIDDNDQRLDFNELNSILEGILGVKVNKIETIPGTYHLIVKISDLDLGTKKCPFWFLSSSGSYPLKVKFPKLSDATKNYLKKIYPNGNVTDTRIFAFRLIHFLLHKLGYHDHFDEQKIDDYQKFEKALQEGDPKQVPPFDTDASCFNDWEALHFIAVQPNLPPKSFDNIVCKQCKTTSIPVGVGFEDLKQMLHAIKEISDVSHYFRGHKDIFYVVGVREDGAVLNLAPYKSKETVDVGNKEWFETIIEVQENLSNIFVPKITFSRMDEIKKGDKILVEIDLITEMNKNQNGFKAKIQRVKTAKVLKRGVKIIDSKSLFSRILPFRLGVVFKIGPETDLQYMKKVAKIVNHLTSWRVRIDTSSYEDLKNSFRMLDEIAEKWKGSNKITRGQLVSQTSKIINSLPKVRDVEDRFEVNVYVFPEKYSFIQDVYGTVAYGEALHRLFAVVSIYPKKPTAMHAFCEDCRSIPINPFSEAITAIFVIHEIMHITSGLSDHHSCSICAYNQKEMQPFQRYYCEECIREGNNQIKKNCLMSYECITCVAIKCVKSPKNSLSQFLCQQCRKKVLPADKFAARQASRMNAIIYHQLLMPKQ